MFCQENLSRALSVHYVNNPLTSKKVRPNLEIDQRSIESYLLIASIIPGVTDVGRTKYKTGIRIMSENSIRSAVSYSCVIAVTHLSISLDTKWETKLNNATDGAKNLPDLFLKPMTMLSLNPFRLKRYINRRIWWAACHRKTKKSS